MIAWEREILINSLWWSSPATSLMPRVPVWIFHLLLLAFPQRTRLHLQSQPKDRRIQRMQRSKNKQCGYEWQTLSQGCIQRANQSLQHVYKAQASSTEEEVTSTGGLLLKRRILTTAASKVNDVVLSPYYCIINTMLRRGKHNWNRCYVFTLLYHILNFNLGLSNLSYLIRQRSLLTSCRWWKV